MSTNEELDVRAKFPEKLNQVIFILRLSGYAYLFFPIFGLFIALLDAIGPFKISFFSMTMTNYGKGSFEPVQLMLLSIGSRYTFNIARDLYWHRQNTYYLVRRFLRGLDDVEIDKWFANEKVIPSTYLFFEQRWLQTLNLVMLIVGVGFFATTKWNIAYAPIITLTIIAVFVDCTRLLPDILLNVIAAISITIIIGFYLTTIGFFISAEEIVIWTMIGLVGGYAHWYRKHRIKNISVS